MTIRLRSNLGDLEVAHLCPGFSVTGERFRFYGVFTGFRWTSHTLLTGLQSLVPLKLAEATQSRRSQLGPAMRKRCHFSLCCFVLWRSGCCQSAAPVHRKSVKKALKGFMERVRIVVLDF